MDKKGMNERIVFDESITLERYSSDSPEGKKLSRRRRSVQNKTFTFTLSELIDMLAGYQMSEHNIVDFIEESGECKICGKKTNSEIRKICYECHGEHIYEIYKAAKECVETGKDTIDLELER